MRKILIVGIGAGDPDYLTIQAVKALNQADVVFIPNKGTEKAALRQLRTQICERYIVDRTYRVVEVPIAPRSTAHVDYRSSVEAWHRGLEQQYREMLTADLSDGECGAFLVWGDPSLYDSTLRILDALRSEGAVELAYEVIPGISSVQALAARHRIALNRIGEPVHITTGRRLADGFPDTLGSVVVMLDGEQAFARLDRDDLDIFWGAYLGTEDEVLVSGRLSEVGADIARIREERRRDKGWIMDTYLLRTRRDG